LLEATELLLLLAFWLTLVKIMKLMKQVKTYYCVVIF